MASAIELIGKQPKGISLSKLTEALKNFVDAFASEIQTEIKDFALEMSSLRPMLTLIFDHSSRQISGRLIATTPQTTLLQRIKQALNEANEGKNFKLTK